VGLGGRLSVPAPGVLANDTDPEGGQLTARLVIAPQFGTVNLATNGPFVYTHTGATAESDFFVYEVTDADGLTAQATVTITVTNLAPIAGDDNLTMAEDDTIVFAPLANDVDPEGQALYLTSWEMPTTGSMLVLPNDTIRYLPPRDFHGIVTAGYTVADGAGATAHGTIRITVLPVNDAPLPRPDSATSDSYQPIRMSVLNNDTDPDGDTVEIISLGEAAHGNVYRTDTGEVVYDPHSGWEGEDRFSYTVSDGNGASATTEVTVTITHEAFTTGSLLAESIGINALPFAAPIVEHSPLSIGILATEGISLLAASFWQTVLALQVPLLFLALAFALVFFAGGAVNAPHLIGRRRRYHAAVLLGREDRLAVHADPNEDSDVVHRILPTARSLFARDKPKMVAGTRWVPIEIPSVAGWVDSQYLIEEMDYGTFLDDERPARLVADLARALRTGGSLNKLVSPRGLAIALAHDVTLIKPQDLNELSRQLHQGNTHIEYRGIRLSEQVIRPFLAAYDATGEVNPRTAHSSSALLPSECQNFLYLTLEPDANGRPWLVYIEYRGKRPYIAGLGIDV